MIIADGSLTGIPAESDVGLNEFVARVTDPNGLFDEAVLQISVGQYLLLFSDDFERTASTVIGNGWVEDLNLFKEHLESILHHRRVAFCGNKFGKLFMECFLGGETITDCAIHIFDRE